MGIFSNLFRGEMLEKTLHYYYLTPMRRELLVAGKYLAGLAVALVLFVRQRGAVVPPASAAISAPPGRTTLCTAPASASSAPTSWSRRWPASATARSS